MRDTRDTNRVSSRRAGIRMVRALLVGSMVVVAGCQMAPPRTDPAQQRAELSRGITLLRAGQYPQAYDQFNAMRPFTTRNADALSGLAISADLTGNRRSAERAYDALSKVASNQAAFFNNRGYSRMLNGELQGAYDDLTRAANIAPQNEKIRNNLRMLRAVLPRREQF